MKIEYGPKFWNSFERCFSTKPWYLFPRLFRDTRHKKMAWQRVVRGYDDEWWWAFHEVFSEMALANLKILKSRRTGYPFRLKDEEWDAKLQEMIDGFQAAIEIDKGWMPLPELEAKFKKGMATFTEYYFNLWD